MLSEVLMSPSEFEQLLHEQIPITKAMEISVIEFSASKVKVSAQLKPNINHMATAFGGSINCLMTVCGWSMMYAIMKEIAPEAHIVIQKSSIDYLRPIHNDFIAECELTEQADKLKFLDMYQRHKKGKLPLKVFCYEKDILLAQYEGQYAAFL
jgi:thioesterase domain-containing protein